MKASYYTNYPIDLVDVEWIIQSFLNKSSPEFVLPDGEDELSGKMSEAEQEQINTLQSVMEYIKLNVLINLAWEFNKQIIGPIYDKIIKLMKWDDNDDICARFDMYGRCYIYALITFE